MGSGAVEVAAVADGCVAASPEGAGAVPLAAAAAATAAGAGAPVGAAPGAGLFRGCGVLQAVIGKTPRLGKDLLANASDL